MGDNPTLTSNYYEMVTNKAPIMSNIANKVNTLAKEFELKFPAGKFLGTEATT